MHYLSAKKRRRRLPDAHSPIHRLTPLTVGLLICSWIPGVYRRRCRRHRDSRCSTGVDFVDPPRLVCGDVGRRSRFDLVEIRLFRDFFHGRYGRRTSKKACRRIGQPVDKTIPRRLPLRRNYEQGAGDAAAAVVEDDDDEFEKVAAKAAVDLTYRDREPHRHRRRHLGPRHRIRRSRLQSLRKCLPRKDDIGSAP